VRIRHFLPLCAASLLACGEDPLIGHWEADNDKVELDIEAGIETDYRGTGAIFLCPVGTNEGCRLCTIKYEVTDKGGGQYEFEGAFVGKCDVFGEFDEFECDLVEGDLECELPGEVDVEYERQEEEAETEE
jgi:hypothetical protein